MSLYKVGLGNAVQVIGAAAPSEKKDSHTLLAIGGISLVWFAMTTPGKKLLSRSTAMTHPKHAMYRRAR